MKKLIALLLALLTVLSLVACTTAPEGDGTPDGPDTPEEEKNILDIYLIAGQSNAAGHTKVRDTRPLYNDAPGLEEGYSHVLYAGNARQDNGTTVQNNDKTWRPTTLGFGIERGAVYMGPEAGIAAALSEYYNEESGRYAGIIKMAHGGTGLLNNTTGSNQFGNWMPPSYAEHLNIAWENEPITGVLYRELLDTVERHVTDLAATGVEFDGVCIKGMYWMQGCNNRYVPNEYRLAFIMFAEDLRADLSELMIELTGEDCGAAEMPIFVGTISETFSLQDEDTPRTVNRPFIRMQKELPKAVEHCYVVDNSQYKIGQWDSLANEVVVLGSDAAHWNQEDMLDIGMNAGKMMLDVCIPKEE